MESLGNPGSYYENRDVVTGRQNWVFVDFKGECFKNDPKQGTFEARFFCKMNIKNLIKILEESNVDELEVSTFWGKQTIRIRKNISSTTEKNIELIQETTTVPLQSTKKLNEVHESEPEEIEPVQIKKEVALTSDEEKVTIKAPLVGTYYASSKPGATPFISEGDTVKKGQIICIIEAMKIFNEIESEYSGKILKILVEDATPVEYDQDLLIISPE